MTSFWPLLLPFAIISSWFAGRRWPWRREFRCLNQLSREYYQGLNYLLNEQPDKAVDVFIKLLEVDSETVETHLALGNLFRRRGETDRAIRIHQNLIARTQLNEQQRLEALMALGRDYMSAGVFDRAEEIFKEVVDYDGEYAEQSLKYLLDIYQQEKAWPQAIEVVDQLAATNTQQYNPIIAHHYCELAVQSMYAHDYEQVTEQLQQALCTDRSCVRASLLQAECLAKQGNHQAAIIAYQRVCWQDPDYLSIAIKPLTDCYQALNRVEECEAHLQALLAEHPRVSIIMILAERMKAQTGIEAAADFVAAQLRRYPSIRGLNQLIFWHLETTHGKIHDKLDVLYEITNKLLENKPIYRCNHCGYAGKHLHWLCPSCKQWSKMKPIHGLEGD